MNLNLLNIKNEIEEFLDFKSENLDNEDGEQHMLKNISTNSQSFSDNEANFSLAESVKNEGLDQTAAIKSEEWGEFVFVEVFVRNGTVKSEDPKMMKESSEEHKKTLDCDSDEEAKNSKVESTSRSRPEVQATYDQRINCQNFGDEYCNFTLKSNGEFKNFFKCVHCIYETNFKSKLNRHMLIHNDTKRYKCPHCNYECNQKGQLKTHTLNHANIKLFKCFDCSYECMRKEHLKRHMLTHGNIKLFKCSDCDYECNRKEHLDRHMLSHAKIKLFKCLECSYESNQKEHFKRHLVKHGDKKLFQCCDCNYECNQKGQLKRHLLKHRGIKLFKCTECNCDYNDKSSLKRHMIKHGKLK